MDNHVFDTTEILLAALTDEFVTLQQLKQILEGTKYWPKTVASLQTIDESKRVMTLLLAALIRKPDCTEQLDRETAPDVESMVPVLRKLVASNLFAKKLRRLMNGMLNEPMPTYLLPRKWLVSKVKEHRGKVKVPQDITTVDALRLWMQRNQVFNKVAGNSRLVFTDATGTAMTNYLCDNRKIYCSINHKKERKSMRRALVLTLIQMIFFGVYSTRKINATEVSFEALILDALAVFLFCFDAVRMYFFYVDCRATSNMKPFIFTLLALGFAIVSTFLVSWPCIASIVLSVGSLVWALIAV